MPVSKRNAQRLAKNGSEMGANVLRGVLIAGPDGLTINNKNVMDWLAQHADSEIVLIAAPMDQFNQAGVIHTCYTCGRDYEGDECPRCAEARARLRR